MRVCIVIAAAAVMGACTPGVSKDNLPAVVAHVNNGGADHLLDDFPGVKLSARIDEGDTLVLKATNFPSGTQTFDPNALRKYLRPTVCESGSYRELIEQGGKVRFEFVSNFGKELPPIQFAHCG